MGINVVTTSVIMKTKLHNHIIPLKDFTPKLAQKKYSTTHRHKHMNTTASQKDLRYIGYKIVNLYDSKNRFSLF